MRYECEDDPNVHLICHCRDCQKASGADHAALMFVPSDRLTFSGISLAYFESKGASRGSLQRGFCPRCGSQVAARWPEGMLCQLLQAGSLDDPSIFSPTVECWMSRADSWHTTHPATTKFDEGPAPEATRDRIRAYFAGRAASG